MKKLALAQMATTRGGCWEFNLIIFGRRVATHYCQGDSTDGPSYWAWF